MRASATPPAKPAVNTGRKRKAERERKPKAPANVGTCVDVVLINPESNEVALGIEESIRENEHGQQVNFAFITKPDADGNANIGKPTPEVLEGVRERNDFRGRGYVPSAKRWFMERENFKSLVKEFQLTVHGE